jgi:hypothetical protein
LNACPQTLSTLMSTRILLLITDTGCLKIISPIIKLDTPLTIPRSITQIIHQLMVMAKAQFLNRPHPENSLKIVWPLIWQSPTARCLHGSKIIIRLIWKCMNVLNPGAIPKVRNPSHKKTAPEERFQCC